MRVNDTASFVAASREAHGDRYGYDRVEYRRNDVPVTIVCPDHGEFLQKPINHRRGKGCPRCGEARRMAVVTDTAEGFIRRAREVHGDRYGYGGVVYVNRSVHVVIECPDHGVFRQEPERHLAGRGCPRCKGRRISDTKRMTTSEFVEKAIAVHGDRYDYGDVDHLHSHAKVTIHCRRHGPFLQKSGNHLYLRNGCPVCGRGTVSESGKRWLDEIGVVDREVRIPGTKYRVDGYDPATRTVYEYLGGFWHGHPERYHAEDVNPVNGMTFGELYRATMERFDHLKSLDYRVVFRWGD